jgi:hypothetical protein
VGYRTKPQGSYPSFEAWQAVGADRQRCSHDWQRKRNGELRCQRHSHPNINIKATTPTLARIPSVLGSSKHDQVQKVLGRICEPCWRKLAASPLVVAPWLWTGMPPLSRSRYLSGYTERKLPVFLCKAQHHHEKILVVV